MHQLQSPPVAARTMAARVPAPEVLSVGRPVGVGFARRTLDIAGSLAGLIVLSPLLLAAALAVRLSSPGPVLFRQARVGAGGRSFTLYKFRSMRVASGGGPELTLRDDARVTLVGRVIRSMSIDELPQLVNVLRGDMTLVGPRPETIPLAERYPLPCRVIFRFRPGLTGASQLRCRSIPDDVVDVERYYLERLVPLRVALELDYLDDPSLGRTVALIGETITYVLRHLPGLPDPRGIAVPASAGFGAVVPRPAPSHVEPREAR